MRAFGLIRQKWWLVLTLTFLLTLPLYGSLFHVRLVNEMAIFALCAVATNLMLGYGGTMPFGQAAFFGTGAYACGLLLLKTGVPFPLCLLAGGILPACLAVIVGFFSLRLTGIYFAMITLAFSMMIWGLVWKWYSFTGGDDGLVGIPLPSAFAPVINYYYLCLGIIAFCIILLFIIVRSPFGSILQAIRDNRVRTEFVGINAKRHLLAGFVISGFFCGLGGALFALLSRGVFTEFINYPVSVEIVLMCILGGVFSFAGPALGAVVVILLESLISSYTEYWLVIMGLVLILLVEFVPGGIIGLTRQRKGA
jgi:branched-chain amino acid transport system permease protein